MSNPGLVILQLLTYPRAATTNTSTKLHTAVVNPSFHSGGTANFKYKAGRQGRSILFARSCRICARLEGYVFSAPTLAMSDLGNDLCKKLGPRRARDRGSPFSAPKEFSVEEYELAERGPGRWVVTWWLPLPARNGKARKSRYHAYYHRVVGLAMRLCPHDVLERKLPRPRLVPPDKWGEYEVDHANDNTLGNRLANLEPV